MESITVHCGIVVLLFHLARGGDDASVHVHVESAPAGNDMAMLLPLFKYFRAGMGGAPNPEFMAQFSKWHGDEVHSQGPDAPAVQPPMPPMPVSGQQSSAEQHGPQYRPLRIAPSPLAYGDQAYYAPGEVPLAGKTTGPHSHRTPTVESGPLSMPYPQRRTVIDYDIPFRGVAKHTGPRHQHGGTVDTIPKWVLRKRQLNKYGMKKYLQPYSVANLEALGDLERLDRFDPNAEPIFPRSSAARLVGPSSAEVMSYFAQPERDDYDSNPYLFK